MTWRSDARARLAATEVHSDFVTPEARTVNASPLIPDLTRALDALDAVLALHAPQTDKPLTNGDPRCAECWAETWPCPTVRAIEGDA